MFKKLSSALALSLFGFSLMNAQMIEDFETGLSSVTGLTFRNQGQSFNISDCQIAPLFGSTLNPSFTGFDLDTEKASIVTAGNIDPILSGYGISQNVVGPNGGNYAMRLNNLSGGASDITSAEFTFKPSDTFLSFDYMLVFDSDHISNLPVQPFFTARLLDMDNTIIQSTEFCIAAYPDNPLLSSYENKFFYTDGWFCGLLIIPEEYLEKKIKVKFIISDCGAGSNSHVGVSYIDNIANENKCDQPQFGYINLDRTETACSPKSTNVCGTFSAPHNSVLDAIELEVLQNGVPLSILPGAISLTYLTNDTFCYNVNFGAMGIFLDGSYEFKVTAKFLSTINGYPYYLSDESTNIGSDVRFNNEPPLEAFIDFDNYTITWPAIGGPYYVEFWGDLECCPLEPGDSTEPAFATLITYNNTISFFEGIQLLQRKCLRFRVKAECSSWTQWCCITSHTPEDAGYVIPERGLSYNCVDLINIQSTPQQQAYVYPNATTGNITIKNSNSLNFEIYDYNNNLVVAKKIAEVQEEVTLDLHSLKQGIYILKTDKGHSIKIIKN
jgi:hypothetical protein